MILRYILAGALCLVPTGALPYWQSRAQVGISVAPSYTGPGDVVSGAVAWWGLRGYNAAYTGNVANICDAATGLVCANITWSGTALVLPLIGGIACNNVTNVCNVATLYDQSGALACSGAACDLVQSTNSRRPALIVPGASNGCPTDAAYCMAHVRASQQCLLKATGLTATAPVSSSFVAIRTGNVTSTQNVITAVPAVMWNGFSNAANTIATFNGTLQTKASITDSTWHAVQTVWSNSVGSLSADGSTTTANNGTNSISGGVLLFGASAGTCATALALDGKSVEGGIWPSDITSLIPALNTNQHAYWGF